MSEFFSVIFSPANAIATGLFVLIIVYWITVILGAVDMDTIEVDVEIDVDVDADLDVEHDIRGANHLDLDQDSDSDMEGNASTDISYLNYILRFFNIGKVPFMLWLSFVVLPLWAITLIINGILNFESFLPGLLVFLPTLIGCLFLAKILTWPFVKVFEKMKGDDLRIDLVGGIGIVSTTIFADSKGQVNLSVQGSSFTIYAKALNESEIKKGTQVLVIKKASKNDVYYVEPYTH